MHMHSWSLSLSMRAVVWAACKQWCYELDKALGKIYRNSQKLVMLHNRIAQYYGELTNIFTTNSPSYCCILTLRIHYNTWKDNRQEQKSLVSFHGNISFLIRVDLRF
jgi:hypothetical protein